MLKLQLFVAGDDEEIRSLHRNLVDALAANMPKGAWHVDLVDVVQMPEKALEKDVFATPMLLRELPVPVIKVIGDIAQTQRVLALIQGPGEEGQMAII